MLREYGISTLKYPKNIWGGGTDPPRRLRRLASSRAPSALDLPPPQLQHLDPPMSVTALTLMQFIALNARYIIS